MEIDRNATACRQTPCFRNRRCRKVEGGHGETLPGEPDAVAAVTIGDTERGSTGRKAMGVGPKEGVGAFAVEVAVTRVTLVPVGCGFYGFGHRSGGETGV
jgi:hypothetical protein